MFLTLLQVCQIFLGSAYQNGKNIPDDDKMYPMVLKNTEWPENYQMAVIYFK
jgi:hypothetical protein